MEPPAVPRPRLLNTDADIYAGSNADKTLSLLLSLSSPHLLSFPRRVVSLVSRKFAASRDDRKKRKKEERLCSYFSSSFPSSFSGWRRENARKAKVRRNRLGESRITAKCRDYCAERRLSEFRRRCREKERKSERRRRARDVERGTRDGLWIR